MWLNDPYVIEQWLQRHAELTARGSRAGVGPAGDGSSFRERAGLALRVLTDAALAERVRDAAAGSRQGAPPRRARASRA